MPRRESVALIFLAVAPAFAQWPVVTSLTPNWRLTADPAFTMTVTGSGFNYGCVVFWNATPLTTTYVSSFQVTASVPGALFQGVLGDQYFNITVMNPDGLRSNPSAFHVIEPFRVTSLAPPGATAGAQQFTLTVNGSKFSPDMYVRWNGVRLVTTFVSNKVLTAVVPASLVASPGTAEITVYQPGHGSSVPVAFQIQPFNPPVLTSLGQNSAAAGGPQFTLVVNGANFVPGVRVRWNGAALDTNLVSSAQLTAVVPASHIATGGTATITVLHPNGTVSNSLTFTVACSFRVSASGSAAASAAIPGGGGSGSILVATTAGCSWTVATAASWLSVSPWSGTGNGVIAYSAGPNAGALREATLAIAGQTFTVTQLSSVRAPMIAGQRAVVNAASMEPGVTSGGWVSIFGTDLSTTTRSWTEADFIGGRLPTKLDGVGVNINGKAAYVSYVSPTQVNALAPDDPGVGAVLVEVVNVGGKSNLVTVEKRKVSPAFFTLPPQEGRYVAAVLSDGMLAGREDLFEGAAASRPVKPGETVSLYATGLGPTVPVCPAGEIARQPAALGSDITVRIGGVPAAVDFAGIVGPGLYQINVRVPDLPDGDAVVQAETQGHSSQEKVHITVRR